VTNKGGGQAPSGLSLHSAEPDNRGRTSHVEGLSRRDITFVAFDLLVLDDDNLHNRPYRDRRRGLEALDVILAFAPPRALDGSPRDLLDACAQLDVEGVVAKRVDSQYRPGIRSGDWLKLKTDWKHGPAPRRHR